VRYLLDVNALIALGVSHHQFYQRMVNWVTAQPQSTQLFTTPIVELGFRRVLAQTPAYNLTLADGKTLLSEVKSDWFLHMLPDDRPVSDLPKWVKSHKQLTDGHLVDLAKANRAFPGLLATFDKAIPGAFLIP
jgi:predicted nucleic acid-binding protein